MTGPGSSSNTGPDLAALREKAERASNAKREERAGRAPRDIGAELSFEYACTPDVVLAVLSRLELAEEENERMREALEASEAAQ